VRAAGRPKKGVPVTTSTKVTVILDDELRVKFEALPRPAGLAKGHGWRSVILRQLIEEEFERIKK
jgi:hypothetical protein